MHYELRQQLVQQLFLLQDDQLLLVRLVQFVFVDLQDLSHEDLLEEHLQVQMLVEV